MKRLQIYFMLTVLLSLIDISATAHDIAVANSDGVTIYYIWTNNNMELSVSYLGSSYSSYSNEYSGNVVIPETVTYNGTTYSVTSINNCAFEGCSSLTSVTIPNSVTSIGGYAFYGCPGLTSVTIPGSVTSIGSYAFYGCNWLTSITIPSSVMSIAEFAFYRCSGLTSVTIPNSVTSIAKCAFYECSGLTSITIPSSLTSIGSYAFYGCSRLTSVTIPNSVTSIAECAFYGCSRLTSVTIPNSVTSIGNNAFSNCYGLRDIKVPVIDYSAFCSNTIVNLIKSNTGKPIQLIDEGGNEIKDFVIPEGTTSIGNSAFNGCSSLTSVTIPNSVTSIGSYAFQNCNNLESFTIGSGVLTIGNNVFDGHKPAKVIWLTNTPPTGYTYAAGTVNYVANNLYTSLSNKTEYKFLSSLFEVDGVKYVPVSPSERTCDAIDCRYDDEAENIHIGKTVTNKGITLTVKQVHPYAFYGNPYIKDVDLSFDGNVGSYSFYGCKNLESIVVNNTGIIDVYAFGGSANSTNYATLEIGSKVTNINNSAFSCCKSLKTATINNKGSIGNSGFQGCTSLETATLGEEITSLGESAFRDCSSLKSIVIPNSVKTIGQYAFQNCSAMTYVKIGTGVTNIATYTFSGCSGLTDMQIGSNVTTINTYAFKGCSSLPTINIPRAVTQVKNYVFSNCTGLKIVIMEDRETVLDLGNNGSSPLFSDCPLDSVYIGGNISYNTSSSYGYSPFYRNTSLRSVVITDKETEISENEFYGCTSLKSISIGDGVESIGNWAFSGCSSLDYFAFGTALKTIGKEAFSDCTEVTKIISRAATPPTCGSQALDDINKWTCSLSVPPGGVETYQAADQWKEFFFIQEESDTDLWFKLTYLVDGEEYKSYTKLYGTTITPETEPEKEGYSFSGWSLIPETMPARDVIIVGSFSKNPEEQSYEPDLSQTDNVIYINSVEARVDSELTLSIKMKNNVGIRGFQFDLYLPDGVNAVKTSTGRIKASLTADRLPEDDAHTLTVSEQQDGSIRFLCGSQYDETFTGNEGEIATIKLSISEDMAAGNYPLVLSNIKLTETDINRYYVTASISSILTVYNYVTGDISGDGEVDVSDYIGIANHIIGKTPEGFNVKAADVNGDEAIDVSDYIGVANIILYGNIYGNTINASRSVTRMENTYSASDNLIYIEPLKADANSQATVSFKMKNTADIRGFQFDLYLPEGISMVKNGKNLLSDSRKPVGDQHALTLSEQQDGAIRFLCSSINDETFTGNDGEIATLTVSIAGDMVQGDYPILLKKMKLSESDISNYYETESRMATITINNNSATGIEQLTTGSGSETYYNLQGQRVSTPAKGVFVKNGKKVMMK